MKYQVIPPRHEVMHIFDDRHTHIQKGKREYICSQLSQKIKKIKKIISFKVFFRERLHLVKKNSQRQKQANF